MPKELESKILGTKAHGRIFHVKTSTTTLFMALIERLLFHKHLALLDHFKKKSAYPLKVELASITNLNKNQ